MNDRAEGILLLPQAELMEFRMAWLDADEARKQAIETQGKLNDGKDLVKKRKKELEDSQGPIKYAAIIVTVDTADLINCTHCASPYDKEWPYSWRIAYVPFDVTCQAALTNYAS